MKLVLALLLAALLAPVATADLCAEFAGLDQKTKASAKCTTLGCGFGSGGGDFDSAGWGCCEVNAAYKQPCILATGLDLSSACDGADTATANYDVTTSATAKCAAAACLQTDFAADKPCCVAANQLCTDAVGETDMACITFSHVKMATACAGAVCAATDFKADGASQCCYDKERCTGTSVSFSCDAGFALTDDNTALCADETCDATVDKAACCKALPACAGATWTDSDGDTDTGECPDGQKIKAAGKCTGHNCWSDFQVGDTPHCCEVDSAYKQACSEADSACTWDDDTEWYEPVWYENHFSKFTDGIPVFVDHIDYMNWDERNKAVKCAKASCDAEDFKGGTGACCVKKNQWCSQTAPEGGCAGDDIEVEPAKRCPAALCVADDFVDATKTCCRAKQALCSSATFACDDGSVLPPASVSDSVIYSMSIIGGMPTGATKKCKGATCTETDDKATCCMPLPACSSAEAKVNSYLSQLNSRNGGPEEGQKGAAPPAVRAGAPLLVALAVALAVAQPQ